VMADDTRKTSSGKTPRPMDGVRVIDLSTVLAGPHCATLLGEFGADVIKVELPGVGDSLRKFWPQYNGTALIWRVEARNKRCVTLDMRKEQGKEIIKKLVAISDVVVENFRPGTLERWGLGYEDLKAVNPGIVMVRVSGYGQTGPYAQKPGFGRVAAAYGGLSNLAGFPDRPPVIPGTASIPDYLAGVYGALGAMMALRHKDKTGEGQYVDIALYDPVLRILEEVPAAYHKMGLMRERLGTGSMNAVPHNHYTTSDGRYLAIACTNNTMFQRLVTAMGRPELAEDPRFSTNAQRIAHREETDAMVQEWVGSQKAKPLIALLEENEVPVTLVYNVADMFEDPQYQARESIISVDDPVDGEIKMSAVVPRLSLTPGRVESTGPEMGVHNREVYCDLLGYPEEELARWKEEGLV